MKHLTLDEIRKALDIDQAIRLQREGFCLYSQKQVVVPPVGYLNFGADVGETHIKYGWIKEDPIFVIKIASAFYQNPALYKIPSIQGMFLVIDAKTGQPYYLLEDSGYLTQIRTAIAGLIAAESLAPKRVSAIGMVGTGAQARLQAIFLQRFTKCRKLHVWGRDLVKLTEYARDMTQEGFEVTIAKSPADICQQCNLIITTTSAKEPLIFAKDVQPGTHITAIGADAPGKQELDPTLYRLADLCVVDSKEQCLDHGESHHPVQAGLIEEKELLELGEILLNPQRGRQSKEAITIADLTGVSIQDIQIVKAVLPNS